MCLVLFLAALDQTIIATALPTIAEQFHATPSQFSWIVTVSQVGSRRVGGADRSLAVR